MCIYNAQKYNAILQAKEKNVYLSFLVNIVNHFVLLIFHHFMYFYLCIHLNYINEHRVARHTYA